MNYMTSMELTTLLNRIKQSVSNLTASEFRMLSYLLTRVNNSKITTNGYSSWPSTQSISDFTGLSTPTIERSRKTLVQAGWMQYVPGNGPGNSNTYYINAQKIVDCVAMSGEKASEKAIAKTIMIEKDKAKRANNPSGLVQNKDKPKEIQKVVDKPVSKPIIVVDEDDPFGGHVAPKKVESVKGPGKNPDGSDPFFPNGQRRYSYKDVMDPFADDPDVPF